MARVRARVVARVRVRVRARIRVETPEVRLAEAVTLVVRAHHPVVLHDERRAALALHGPLDEVLEAVGEEARVHHRDREVGDEELREDLVEALLVVLLRMTRLRVRARARACACACACTSSVARVYLVAKRVCACVS